MLVDRGSGEVLFRDRAPAMWSSSSSRSTHVFGAFRRIQTMRCTPVAAKHGDPPPAMSARRVLLPLLLHCPQRLLHPHAEALLEWGCGCPHVAHRRRDFPLDFGWNHGRFQPDLNGRFRILIVLNIIKSTEVPFWYSSTPKLIVLNCYLTELSFL